MRTGLQAVHVSRGAPLRVEDTGKGDQEMLGPLEGLLGQAWRCHWSRLGPEFPDRHLTTTLAKNQKTIPTLSAKPLQKFIVTLSAYCHQTVLKLLHTNCSALIVQTHDSNSNIVQYPTLLHTMLDTENDRSIHHNVKLIIIIWMHARF